MKLFSITVLATAALTGCLADREYRDPYDGFENGFNDDYDDEEWSEDEYYYQQTELRLGQPRVVGDIGGVRDFDAAANDSYGSVDDEWGTTNVTLTAYDQRGRMGMIILWMDGQDIRTMPAGAHVLNVQSGQTSVTGCSDGDDSYYDQPATDGEVVITDTEQGREVVVEAEFPSYENPDVTTQATGSFLIVQ